MYKYLSNNLFRFLLISHTLGLLVPAAVADTNYWDEYKWEENSGWQEIRPNDVNPDINNWATYDTEIVTATQPNAPSVTVHKWIATNTAHLGVVPVTQTVGGSVQVTSSTQYVQFASKTVVQGGSSAVETSMLVAPALWDTVFDAASEACNSGLKKRQLCDLGKMPVEEISLILYNQLLKKKIIISSIALWALAIEIKTDLGRLDRAQVNRIIISGTPPAPSKTSESEVTVTAWVDPVRSEDPDLVKQLAAASLSALPSDVEASTTPTSLACSTSNSAMVSATAAFSNIVQFCGQQDHLVPINPTASISQSFPNLDQNNSVSVSWVPDCKSNNPPYILDQNDCTTYLNGTINGCDDKSEDKHGGTLTVDCVLYAVKPEAWVSPQPVDDPHPTPDPTSIKLNCASPTPNAAMFSKSDAVKKINDVCEMLGNKKVVMAGQPIFGQSDGVTDNCGTTSNDDSAISVKVVPNLASPCAADNVPTMDFSDKKNVELCKTNLNQALNDCGQPTQPSGQKHWKLGGTLVQNCYIFGVNVGLTGSALDAEKC